MYSLKKNSNFVREKKLLWKIGLQHILKLEVRVESFWQFVNQKLIWKYVYQSKEKSYVCISKRILS